jgi:hypothetical protein
VGPVALELQGAGRKLASLRFVENIKDRDNNAKLWGLRALKRREERLC